MIPFKYYRLVFLLGLVLPVQLPAQPLSIEDCYELARKNYPLIKKQELIAKSAQYTLENASKLHLPQLSVNGQATYQSQTISFSSVLGNLPNATPPEISKDQYKIQAELNQSIYDGGFVRNQRELARANEQVQQQSLEVSLNTVKDRVNQAYFSVLLINEQLKQNDTRKSDLQSILDKANAAFANGTVFRSSVDELKAELINADMAAIELKAGRRAYMDMLSLLIGRPVEENTLLQVPVPVITGTAINRPELKWYDLQKKTIAIQEKQLQSDYMPKLNAFVQGAYGRPTLNIIENKFGAWWMAGLRLSWSAGSLYTLKNNRSLLNISRKNIDTDKETFLFNTGLVLRQQNAEIRKYTELLQQDDAIIALRSAVVQSAKAQLDNGVITVHEYISKADQENMAKQSRIIHQVQLLQAQYNYKNTSGN